MSRTVLEMFIKEVQKVNKILFMHKTAYLLFCLETAENRRLLWSETISRYIDHAQKLIVLAAFV